MQKEFLIQVIPDPKTRMYLTDDQVRANLEIVLSAFFKCWTEGPVPHVQVLSITAVVEPPSSNDKNQNTKNDEN
jgi:hypothetical protein